MHKKIFLSFHYKADKDRVAKIRDQIGHDYKMNPFFDRSKWDALKRHGDHAIKDYINKELKDTDITVVLLGEETGQKKWVNYEIEQSKELRKPIIGIDISKIEDKNGYFTEMGPNPLPSGIPLYSWTNDDGEKHLEEWIEKAARS